MSRHISATQIDELLPQTQCGLCNYKGCMPYANAIATDNAPINLCPPGGVDTLHAIAKLVNESALPYLEDMTQKAKPTMVAVIRENECIGCTKCIQACPVDAILGASKFMHTVIAAECTGCELCITPCPVDCIDLFELPAASKEARTAMAMQARQRFNTRNQRLAGTEQKAPRPSRQQAMPELNKKDFVAAAVRRAQLKKQSAI